MNVGLMGVIWVDKCSNVYIGSALNIEGFYVFGWEYTYSYLKLLNFI